MPRSTVNNTLKHRLSNTTVRQYKTVYNTLTRHRLHCRDYDIITTIKSMMNDKRKLHKHILLSPSYKCISKKIVSSADHV